SAQFVTTLAQEFARSQVLRRLKWAFALLVAVGTAAAGTGVILTRDQPEFPDRVERLSRGLDGEVQEPVDLRSDPLPRGAIRRLGSARFRHGGSVHAMAFSRDGRILTTVSGGGAIRTWDAATGRVDPPIRNKLLASSQEVVFALSTDGSRLAASEIFNLGYDPGPVRLSLIELPGQQFQRTLESVGGAPL